MINRKKSPMFTNATATNISKIPHIIFNTINHLISNLRANPTIYKTIHINNININLKIIINQYHHQISKNIYLKSIIIKSIKHQNMLLIINKGKNLENSLPNFKSKLLSSKRINRQNSSSNHQN
jgi:hypothetical protein